MGSYKIQRLNLPKYVKDVLEKQNFRSCKDVLSVTKSDLQAMLGYNDQKVQSILLEISKKCISSPQSAYDLLHKTQTTKDFAFLPISLHSLDLLLQGGLPAGSISEIVGPPGVGKTQFCFILSIMAASPQLNSGLESHVLYIDTESTFSAQRIQKMVFHRFPNIFNSSESVNLLLQKILVHSVPSLSAFQKMILTLESEIIRHKVKLIIVDSIASLVKKEIGTEGMDSLIERNRVLLEQAAIFKELAHNYNIVIFLTNQISSHYSSHNDIQMECNDELSTSVTDVGFNSNILPALGNTWSHCVSTRLIAQFLDSSVRQLIIAKSPVAPNAAIRFKLDETGPTLTDDDIELLNFSDRMQKNILTKYNFLSSETEIASGVL